LNEITCWGKEKNQQNLDYFCRKGHNILDSIQIIIKLGQIENTTLKVQEKVQFGNGFQELGVDCLLVSNNTIIAILLHNFIPNE
jgi:maleate cis-trans isomerase